VRERSHVYEFKLSLLEALEPILPGWAIPTAPLLSPTGCHGAIRGRLRQRLGTRSDARGDPAELAGPEVPTMRYELAFAMPLRRSHRRRRTTRRVTPPRPVGRFCARVDI
jgi:hypothetical protein